MKEKNQKNAAWKDLGLWKKRYLVFSNKERKGE